VALWNQVAIVVTQEQMSNDWPASISSPPELKGSRCLVSGQFLRLRLELIRRSPGESTVEGESGKQVWAEGELDLSADPT
jgi:hypothetical protein